MAPTDTAGPSTPGPGPMSNVVVGAGELWMPFRDLQEMIDRAVLSPTPENISALENILKIHKPDFVSLLSTKPRSAADREELKKGASEGIYLRGHDGKKVLQANIIQEAFIMSDMFDINEFQALDLLTTADTEVEYHPGWTRGLLAVHMFYEGRAALISSFVSLLQAVPGFTWSSRVNKKLIEVFETFVNQVFQEDMVDRIMCLLAKYKTKQQVETLDANLALGDWRHRDSVLKFIEKIREGLGQIIFCRAAQQGLQWKDALRILEFLKTRLILSEEFELEKEDVLLIMSLLYSLDHATTVPTLNREFATELKRYCTDSTFGNGYQCVELLDMLKLVYFSNSYKLISDVHASSLGLQSTQLDANVAEFTDDDEFEFRKDLFGFLKTYLFSKNCLYSEEEHVMRRLHLFFVDFISYLPPKVKDLKNKCEDAAKTTQLYQEQGLNPPLNLPQDYENFLDCMAMFYACDELGLAADYFSNEIHHSYLNKLVRSATVDQPFMFVHNVKMLTGLAKGCADGVFNLLKQNGHYLSLEHFFDSISKYMGSFGGQVAFNGPSVYASDTYQRVITDSLKFTVNPAEVLGICTYLDLIEALCLNSTAVQHYFTTVRSHWLKMAISAAKIRSIPREIRAKMLSAAAAMIAKESIGTDGALNLWEAFYSTRLIDFGSGDLRDELEDKEARLESYSLTIGLLKLIDSLIDARFGSEDRSPLEINLSSQIDNGVLQPYVTFVRDSVLLKVGYRSYKSVSERWELATLAMGIISKLLDYVPSLMMQMLSDSPLHRMVLGALLDCIRLKEMSAGWGSQVDKCSLQCLTLIRRALARQNAFLYRRELTSGKQGTVVVGIHQLIMKVLHDSGKPDYLLAVIKFIDLLQPENHRNTALEILEMIISGHGETDSHVYSTLASETSTASILRLTLSEFLDDTNTPMKVKKHVLQLVRSSMIHPSPNLALFLLGSDKKIDFQNPGVQGSPRTVLHALLDNAVQMADGFQTLLVLMRDARISASLLRYLRTNQYFVKILVHEVASFEEPNQSMGHFLKCVALELSHTKQPGPLVHTLVGAESGKFQEILERIELQLHSIDIPNLEFFDTALVMEAMKTCEYHDRDLNIKVVRIDLLEGLLKDEITKLEKSNVLKLRKSVHHEAKELVEFAMELNAARQREASKVLIFDGWKQCLEVLLLNPASLKLAGADFVSGMLRLILDKVRSTTSPSEFFLRLAAEVTLTLSSLMRKLTADMKSPTLNVILTHLCAWVSEEQHALVRTYIYGSIYYNIDMLREIEGVTSSQTAFAQLIDHLCRDVSQNSDFGRLQAMYLIGEIIRWTHSKNLGGTELPTTPKYLPNTITVTSPLVAPKQPTSSAPLIPGTPRSFVNSPDFQAEILVKPTTSRKSFIDASTPVRPGAGKTPALITFKTPTASGRKVYSTTSQEGDFTFDSPRTPKLRTPQRVRFPATERGGESSEDEDYGDGRKTSLLDCSSQDLFDTSRLGVSRQGDRGDMGSGKISTSKRLTLSSTTPMKRAMENLSLKSSSQSLLINNLYNKGYLRGLVDALPLVDDPVLMQLFSDRPEAAHMRGLLLFEAKMNLFSRLAWSGLQSTKHLVDVNVILRLSDMTVFDINFMDEQDNTIATREAFGVSLNLGAGRGALKIPNRKERMEMLFCNVLKLFIAMVTSDPKNIMIVDQIWHFITVHDCALATLINVPVIQHDLPITSAFMLTSLMAQIAKKLPADSFKVVRNRDSVYTRIIGILKQQGSEPLYTENRIVLVRNAIQFLYNHAFNTEANRDETLKKLGLVCRPVLTRQLTLNRTRGNLDHEVPIGLILMLVRDSLHRLQSRNVQTTKVNDCFEAIIDIGLSLTLRHVEAFVNEAAVTAFDLEDEPIECDRFKQDLHRTLDEYFPTEGLSSQETGTYSEIMLHRLRRLAQPA